MSTPSVSIIMAVTNRPKHLNYTLHGWSNLNYPDFDFTIIDDFSGNPEIESVVNTFKDKLPITFYKEPGWMNMCRIWNKYGKASRGDYVVFAMMDEIISHGDILQKMMDCSQEARTSIFTYFMSQEETLALDTWNWMGNPASIVRPHSDQTTAGLISHITGNFRKNWDWFGWFRDEQFGHLWLDQDVHLREVALGRNYTLCAHTPKDVWCLHQFHFPSVDTPAGWMRPGYHYANELQARLLEPAKRDIA